MKKHILIMCIMFFSSLAGSPPIDKTIYIQIDHPYKPYEALSYAVAMVETKNNPNAYNALENAVGLRQIRQCKLDDFNQATGKRYKLTDMYDPIKSNEVFIWHCLQFHPSDLEMMARRWNGSGELTKQYWVKVKSYLELL